MDKRGLYLNVVSDIATKILSGEFSPGDKIANEHQLCDDYSVSRTVIRDALRVLVSKGLVRSRPRSGTHVSAIEDWNFLDPDLILWAQRLGKKTGFSAILLEARHTVEPQIAALAALNANADDIDRIDAAYKVMCSAVEDGVYDVSVFNEGDNAFHLAVLNATHNIILKQFGTLILAALTISFEESLQHEKISMKSLHNHGDVLEAIRNKDPYAARKGITEMSQILNNQLNVKTHKID